MCHGWKESPFASSSNHDTYSSLSLSMLFRISLKETVLMVWNEFRGGNSFLFFPTFNCVIRFPNSCKWSLPMSKVFRASCSRNSWIEFASAADSTCFAELFLFFGLLVIFAYEKLHANMYSATPASEANGELAQELAQCYFARMNRRCFTKILVLTSSRDNTNFVLEQFIGKLYRSCFGCVFLL